MTKRFKTYEDLIKERNQLEVLLQAQKELIRADVRELKESLHPAVRAFSVAGKFFTRENNNILVAGGINHLIDLLFKRVILARTGWFAKLVVPFLVKNFSSHVVAERKGQLIQKLFSWIKHKSTSNGQATTDAS
jgi:hypothetical protein